MHRSAKEERDALLKRLAELDAELGVAPTPARSQLASLLDEVEVGIWSFSPAGPRTIYVNPAFLRILGSSRDELFAASTLAPWIHPDDRAAAVSACAASFRGEVGELEARVLRPSGEARICRFRAHTVLDRDGQVERIDTLAIDITEQRAAEEALRSRKRRFKRIAELGWHVVLMIDRDARVLGAFGSMEALTGHSLAEYGALPPEARFHPDDVAMAWGVLNEAVANPGVAVTGEARRTKKGGGWVWTESVVVNLLDDPDVRAIVVNTRDITARKQAEEALHSGKRRFKRIAELGWDVILLLDPEARVLGTFGSMEALTGYSPEEYAALPPEARFHPDDVQVAYRALRESVANPGLAVRGEVRRAKKGGGWVWTETVVLNLFDDPDVRAIVVNYRDITPRKQAEEALTAANTYLERRVAEATASLREANAQLLHTARDKDAFLANMSHELRTPLNAVLGFTEALTEEVYGSVADKQRQALARITTSGTHLLSLINDILDLSKVEAGQVELEVSSVPIAEICRASLAMVEGAARHKRIGVSLQLSNGFGAIEADQRRLKQILVNLLSNAVKFTPDGGSAGLEVDADELGGEARFLVWDTGIGIDPSNLPRLFKPFVQIDSSLSRAHAGTGLGLALVRRLVDLHGGGIEVESTPGKGSRFTVRLPLNRPAAPREAPSPGAARAPVALIVEDYASAAEQLSRYLGELGVASIVHREPRGVVERAAAEKPAMILLDILLPAADGWTILRDLKADARTARIPVIVVSALDRRGDSLALGAADHLVKPVTRDALHASITRLTGEKAVQGPALIAAAGAAPRERRILIAEDDEANVVTILEFLRSLGYEVYVARNGREAVDLTAELLPDVVLMDVQMPVMDGLSAIRELRGHPRPEVRATHVIAVTALAMVGDRERCLAAGADQYLPKPVGLRKLASALEGIETGAG